MRNTQLDSRSARRTIGVIIRDAAADPGCFDTALKMDEDLAPVRIFRVRYLSETTFRDTSVQVGVRYVYAVIAVDTANPANRSPESARTEETARQ